MEITRDTVNGVVKWIQDFFDKNSDNGNAVLGISGGKDSSVAAALCVEALGKDRVIGVLMPNGEQADIGYAIELCKTLGIRHTVVNIANAVNAICDEMKLNNGFVEAPIFQYEVSQQTMINLPARIRMATVYAVSQSNNGRVVNTCNLSEDYIGYSTRYGDAAGDFSPLAHFTVGEVIQIGKILGLPDMFVNKVPSDGLCGKTDEDNLGFTYEVLDKYIRTGVCEDEGIKKLIDRKHELNKFKLELMPTFPFGNK